MNGTPCSFCAKKYSSVPAEARKKKTASKNDHSELFILKMFSEEGNKFIMFVTSRILTVCFVEKP